MADLLDDFVATYRELRAQSFASTDEMAFAARALPQQASHRLAVDSVGSPAFLLEVRDQISPAPAVELSNFAVRHGMKCRIVGEDGQASEVLFTTIVFSGDAALHEYFIRAVGAGVITLKPSPTQREVVLLVQKLAELFNLLDAAPQQSVQGLWAELCLIDLSSDPVRLVRAWRDTPTATFDFSEGEQAVEVKSTLLATRKHHFSYEQLRSQDEHQVLVASFLLEETAFGTSLQQLIASITAKISTETDLIQDLNRKVAASLGSNVQAGLKAQFDSAKARGTLQFFRAANVPTVGEVPVQVSSIRFIVDLSDSKPIVRSASLLGLHHSVRPSNS